MYTSFIHTHTVFPLTFFRVLLNPEAQINLSGIICRDSMQNNEVEEKKIKHSPHYL